MKEWARNSRHINANDDDDDDKIKKRHTSKKKEDDGDNNNKKRHKNNKVLKEESPYSDQSSTYDRIAACVPLEMLNLFTMHTQALPLSLSPSLYRSHVCVCVSVILN